MKINPAVFRAYDIRGVFETDIDEEFAYKIGHALVNYLKINEVVLGNDMRLAVSKIKPALIQGINDAGATVIDIGLTGTEVLYFTTEEFKFKAGIMITASHNPKEYIGFKFVKQSGEPIGFGSGMEELKDMVLQSNLKYKPTVESLNVRNLDPIPTWKKKIQNLVNFSTFKPMKIVVDAGNGVGGTLFSQLFDYTPFEIHQMYFKPNGNFPNHEANPMIEANVSNLKAKMKEVGADLGVAFDGDADRLFLLDKNIEYVNGYFLTAILSQLMIEKKKVAEPKVVHECRYYWAIEDCVKELGGIPIKSKAGHSFIEEKMREVDAIFGGESSAHLYYKDMHYTDSSMLSLALILEKLSRENVNLADLIEPLKNKYFISGEINYEVKDPDIVIEDVKNIYESKGLKADTLDGVVFDSDRDWHISVRKSNTQPLVRLNVEGKSQEIVDKVQNEVEKIILKYGTKDE